MDRLAIHLALHGALVLTVSIAGGLFLYRVILKSKPEAVWHLVHAGGTVRGVLLIALAGIIHLLPLPLWLLTIFAWLIILGIWASMFAMIIAAASSERGLRFAGSRTNKLVYLLYALGIVTIFPACALLIVGLIDALRV